MLSEVNHQGAMLFCERLRESIRKTLFVNGKDSIQLTTSIGYAIMEPGEALSSKELVRRADHALYEAKRNGKNQTIAWQKKDGATISRIEDFKTLRKTGT